MTTYQRLLLVRRGGAFLWSSWEETGVPKETPPGDHKLAQLSTHGIEPGTE